MNATETKTVNLSDAWWTAEHVRVHLSLPTIGATQKWMQRRGVRKCKTDRRLTCRAWIDSALEGSYRPHLVSTTKPKNNVA